MTRKSRVIQAFSAAAGTYESAAEAQRHASARLARLVLAEPLTPSPRVLEVGCGTGLLTRRLLPALGGDWTVTDIAPAMAAAARTCLPGAPARFRVMDGEHPDVEPGSQDLVVSSLAAQWFGDLDGALERLSACLRPGGLLAIATLGAGSFAQWRRAHETLGLSAGLHTYPTAAQLAAMVPPWMAARVIAEPLTLTYADGRAFLAGLKAIGATTPAAGHQPLPPGALRRVLTALGRPAEMTYDLLYLLARRTR